MKVNKAVFVVLAIALTSIEAKAKEFIRCEYDHSFVEDVVCQKCDIRCTSGSYGQTLTLNLFLFNFFNLLFCLSSSSSLYRR
jgi:hypothetical protein